MSFLYRGSEGLLIEEQILGRRMIVKRRRLHRFLHPTLSQLLLRRRTLTEARLLETMRLHGIRVPVLYDYDHRTLYLEFIEGSHLSTSSAPISFYQLGQMIAKLHNLELTHGDLNPANILIEDRTDQIVLLDPSMGSVRADLITQAHDLLGFVRGIGGFENRTECRARFERGYLAKCRTERPWILCQELEQRGRNKH